jgi:hypothetical protein
MSDQAYHLPEEIVGGVSFLRLPVTLATALIDHRCQGRFIGATSTSITFPGLHSASMQHRSHRRGIHISEICAILNYTAEAKGNTSFQRPRAAWLNNLDAVQDRLHASAPWNVTLAACY